MLYDILIIFICMFASLGIVDLAVYIFNCLCARKLPHKFYLLADNFKSGDAEYVIRSLESIISTSGADTVICGIKLGENAELPTELYKKLNNEYRNIIR